MLIVLLLFLTTTIFYAQTPDLFRLEYMLMPKNNADVQLSRIKLVANMHIQTKDSNNIIVGAEYNRIAYEQDLNLGFDNVGLSLLHILDLNLAYVYKYNEDWRFIGVLTPRLSSTLVNKLENGDFSINTTIGAYRSRQNIDKPTRLVLGIAYNSAVSYRIPLPIVYF
ncbi:FIG00551908: hypothetical protein [hydrothermal vent metagenome]|uniref:Uncharacterized protein n=1 Tax=hydrothermal vent metagenome TaxID=652676 RepID=A0A3B0SXF1_9ZZZZ